MNFFVSFKGKCNKVKDLPAQPKLITLGKRTLAYLILRGLAILLLVFSEYISLSVTKIMVSKHPLGFADALDVFFCCLYVFPFTFCCLKLLCEDKSRGYNIMHHEKLYDSRNGDDGKKVFITIFSFFLFFGNSIMYNQHKMLYKYNLALIDYK